HHNKVRTCWNEGRPALAGWLQLPGTLHAEALARLDYDAVVIDMQHSPIDFGQVAPMLIAIELGGAEPFVRTQVNDPSDIMKLLDAGAYGIIAPMVNTRAEAQTLASALHYSPRGLRAFGPRRPSLRYGSGYLAQASETVVGLAMIETREALANIDEILSVDGIDGVFIGPTDLALDLGHAPLVDTEEAEVVSAIAHVRERAHAAGKRVGIFCGSGGFARVKLAEGFDFVTAAPDLAMLSAAARQVIADARAL
uniref:HpcH/HpaI aldolase n=2 Tax=Rhizorhabdus wittichii (strain DSM 6014 / CCUG 31198 / JCM 15750 / NBRC 105917 / EY 4224 / RW1) TaxID=392499 RepID=A0AAT8XT72_RHIWR|nr:Chain A, HpcH/HpaI aldolase [Rhizorhabdus wittichii RW1]7NNK_B Chain B, HpcH/HpaI aldolase [Rhizorhabdus wittichii RW1]